MDNITKICGECGQVIYQEAEYNDPDFDMDTYKLQGICSDCMEEELEREAELNNE